MKQSEAYAQLLAALQTAYAAGEASAMAAWVFEKICALPRGQQLVNNTASITPEVEAQLHELTDRLLRCEPLQYVLNEAFFYGLELYVDASVLIPRPETEELVDWVVQQTPQSKARSTKTDAAVKIFDVGTGSGCIALALQAALPQSQVWACDKTDAALTVARRNGAALDIRVDFTAFDFLDRAQWQALPQFDVVVSNPPYIPLAESRTMAPNVLQYEPHVALFVPNEDPLLFYKALAQFGFLKIKEKGWLYVEISESKGAGVLQLLENAGYQNVELKKDMQGKDRMVRAQRPG